MDLNPSVPSLLGAVVRRFKPHPFIVVGGWVLVTIPLIFGVAFVACAHLQVPENVVLFYAVGSGAIAIGLLGLGYTLLLSRQGVDLCEYGVRHRSLVRTAEMRWDEVQIIQLDTRKVSAGGQTELEPFVAIRAFSGTTLYVTKNQVNAVSAFARAMIECRSDLMNKWEIVPVSARITGTSAHEIQEVVLAPVWDRWLRTFAPEQIEKMGSDFPRLGSRLGDEPGAQTWIILGMVVHVVGVVVLIIWLVR